MSTNISFDVVIDYILRQVNAQSQLFYDLAMKNIESVGPVREVALLISFDSVAKAAAAVKIVVNILQRLENWQDRANYKTFENMDAYDVNNEFMIIIIIGDCESEYIIHKNSYLNEPKIDANYVEISQDENHKNPPFTKKSKDNYLLTSSVYKCHQCAKIKPKLMKCGNCLIASYCDRKCQRKAWPAHKEFCKSINKF